MTNEPTNCRRCGRKLTDPKSIEIGIGPICREKTQPLVGARLLTGCEKCGSHCPQGDGIRDLIPAHDFDAIAKAGLERLPETDFVAVESYGGEEHHMIHMYARNIGCVGIWNHGCDDTIPTGWCGADERLHAGHELPAAPTSIVEWWEMFEKSTDTIWVHMDPDWARVYSFYSGPYYEGKWEPWYMEMVERNDPYQSAHDARAFCFYGCGSAMNDMLPALDWSEVDFDFGEFWKLWQTTHWNLVHQRQKRITDFNPPNDEGDLFEIAGELGYWEIWGHPGIDDLIKPDENILIGTINAERDAALEAGLTPLKIEALANT